MYTKKAILSLSVLAFASPALAWPIFPWGSPTPIILPGISDSSILLPHLVQPEVIPHLYDSASSQIFNPDAFPISQQPLALSSHSFAMKPAFKLSGVSRRPYRGPSRAARLLALMRRRPTHKHTVREVEDEDGDQLQSNSEDHQENQGLDVREVVGHVAHVLVREIEAEIARREGKMLKLRRALEILD